VAHTPPRKLAVILHADVVGSTTLVHLNETLAHQRIRDAFRRFSKTIEVYGGTAHELRGDALIAEFDRASDAIAASLAFQTENTQFNSMLDDDVQPHLRIGVAMGEVVIADNTITGDGIVLAQRLEQLAESGGVCIQDAAYQTVPKRLPFEYENLGEQVLKGFEEPARVFAVSLTSGVSVPPPEQRGTVRRTGWPTLSGVAAAILVMIGAVLAWWQPWALREEPASVELMAFPLPDKPSIAVLPFTNMSGDPEQEYFADGMTEDLITDLSKIEGLFVIARNSSFAYKGSSPDVRRVAEALGVRYVLEGSVRRSGEQVRINAQLIDATTGGHVWADRYDGRLNDVFGLQDEVTRNIVAVLAVQLTTNDEDRFARKETTSAEAYDAFLQGWEHYLRQRPDDMPKAIAQFEKALELDPQYARAYAALASTYWQSWKRGWNQIVSLPRWHDSRVRAEELLKKALQNPTPLAHQLAAAMRLHRHQHEEAINEAERAIALDPNDADAYVALAGALSFDGRPDEALLRVERAMRLNPHYPPVYLYELGMAQFGMAQFEQAAASLEKASALNPDDRLSHWLLLATYGHLGRSEDAARVFEHVQNAGWWNLASIRSIAFWYPFRSQADAVRFAEGLRNAGIPD